MCCLSVHLCCGASVLTETNLGCLSLFWGRTGNPQTRPVCLGYSFSCSLSYAQIRLKLLHLTLAVFWGSKLRSSHLFTSALDLPIHSQSPHGLGEFVQMYFVCIFVVCTCACAPCACCPVIVNDNSKAIYFLCCILQDPFLLLLSTNFMLYITYSCAL